MLDNRFMALKMYICFQLNWTVDLLYDMSLNNVCVLYWKTMISSFPMDVNDLDGNSKEQSVLCSSYKLNIKTRKNRDRKQLGNAIKWFIIT